MVAPGAARRRGRCSPASLKKIPAGRFGEHLELANLAAYLVADGSGYITGECVTIDGGEWLMGGEFNGFTAFDQKALGQMLDAMRPKKRSSQATLARVY